MQELIYNEYIYKNYNDWDGRKKKEKKRQGKIPPWATFPSPPFMRWKSTVCWYPSGLKTS